jgi:hypothetical protein
MKKTDYYLYKTQTELGTGEEIMDIPISTISS